MDFGYIVGFFGNRNMDISEKPNNRTIINKCTSVEKKIIY